MRIAASQLECPATEPAPFLTPVCYLTGAKYWEQTAFCLYSLQKNLNLQIRAIIVDDGTLTGEHIATLMKVAPRSRIVPESESKRRIDEQLDKSAFPTLHLLWHEYKHIRKLIDPHLLGEKAVLVLDSDMLFRRPPLELLEWLESPSGSLVMCDCTESYGYTKEQLYTACGNTVPSLVNVGVTGLVTSDINWSRLEDWSSRLIGAYGRSYFLEQALVAMQISNFDYLILPTDTYAVLPDNESASYRNNELVLGHYVADSKRFYFCEAWRSQV